MAIVTRYFSTAGAGAADGTTWADRAALFSAGNWSTVITGFAFNSTDSLKCLIGPGNYTCGQSLVSGLFTNPPSTANPLSLNGCDSSGVLLAVPDPNWVSAMPDWDTSGLPVIATTTNVNTVALANTTCYLLKFTASARNGTVVGSAIELSWCYVENSHAGLSAAATSVFARNCILKCSGTTYDLVASAAMCVNTRMEGVPGTSGDRAGAEVTGSTDLNLIGCTVVNCGGHGVFSNSINTSGTVNVVQCVIANNGGSGIKGNPTAAQIDWHLVARSMITGNGGYGIDGQSEARVVATGNRLRDNTSGNINGLGNYPTDLNNYTTDAADADDYVDAANGDFRIKNTAAIWGQGFGVADQAAAGGGGGGPLVGGRLVR